MKTLDARLAKLEAKSTDNGDWTVEKLRATYTPAEWQRVMAQVQAELAEWRQARKMRRYATETAG